jgi:hypothetical protein
LLAWRHPLSGAPIVAAVHRRDEIYDGPCVDAAPDLVLEPALERGYSYVWLPSAGDERASVRALALREYVAGKGGGMNGSHRPGGLWTLAGPAIAAGTRAAASITDVAPTVLYLAGLRAPSWMDGDLLAGVGGGGAIVESADGATPAAQSNARVVETDEGVDEEIWRRLVALGYLSGPE